MQEDIDQLWYSLSIRKDERYSRLGQDCLHTKEVLEDAELSRSLRNSMPYENIRLADRG